MSEVQMIVHDWFIPCVLTFNRE